jgi:hypothetical protein
VLSVKESLRNSEKTLIHGLVRRDIQSFLRLLTKFMSQEEVHVVLDLLQYTSFSFDRLCGLVVKVPGCTSRYHGSAPGATRFSEK